MEQNSFLLERAGLRTVSLVLLQALLNYIRFLITDKHTTTECIVKTFVVAPLVIFAIQFSLEKVLWRVRCEHTLDAARGVVLASGLMKSIVFTWSNLSVFQFLQGPILSKSLSVVLTLLVMFGVFCLTGYIETMYLRNVDVECKPASSSLKQVY
jgi:hypothetical protein